jgi:serine/threonine-protein kinase RsbW
MSLPGGPNGEPPDPQRQAGATGAEESRTFAARMDSLSQVAGFLAGFCERHGIARADALRLTLIVEELFSNSVKHGYGGDSDRPVDLRLSYGRGEIALVYEDSAAPYDPLARLTVTPSDLAAPVESRAVGGLGIHLVRELAQSANYAYEFRRNRLWLRIRCAR